jgi:hypothetical protein
MNPSEFTVKFDYQVDMVEGKKRIKCINMRVSPGLETLTDDHSRALTQTLRSIILRLDGNNSDVFTSPVPIIQESKQ